MKVLYATAECWPFAKTGGLGDVSYALPKSLKKEGIDVRVILPKYSTMPNYLKEQLKEVAVFSVDVGWRKQYCGLLEMDLNGVKFYFIDNEYYFKREGEIAYLYGYGDDAERYTFFSNAVLEAMSILNFYPDIVHLNDWHTGMIPLILKEKYSHSKKYKNIKAIDNISFDVKKGEILGLLGPNGSGKSTTINCLLSLLKYEGGIKIFDEEMSPNKYNIKQKIGVVFQDVAIFDELTVVENIDYFCGLYIKDKIKRKRYVDDAIKLVKLEDYRKFYPKQLSGGLLRRLNIACGIAHKPKLIFLDEPTVAVDPQSRNNILDGIKKLRDDGATIVYTTHYMEEAEILCDRIIILDKGKILAQGTSDELKKKTKIEEKITVELNDIDSVDLNKIKKLNNVCNIDVNMNTLVVTYEKGKNNLENLISYLKENKITYNRIYAERPTLNDVFLELTGKELRD